MNGPTMTRATQIAANAIKSKWRGDGHKLQDFRTSEHRKAIAEHLANNPQIISQAAADIRQWTLQGMFGKRQRAKLLNSAQKRSR